MTKKKTNTKKVALESGATIKKNIKKSIATSKKPAPAIKKKVTPTRKGVPVKKTAPEIKKKITQSKGAIPKKTTPPTKKAVSISNKPVKRIKIPTSNKKAESNPHSSVKITKNRSNETIASSVTSVKSPVKEKKQQVFRYSDKELNDFRELINKHLEVARKELYYLQEQMNSELRINLEDGSGAMDREQLSTLISRQVQFISNLEKALIRIINKTYGVCRETGKLISKDRLRAVPHATLSIEAKNKTQGKK